MKIANRAVEGFVKKPDPAMAAVLVYGPDHGLVGERVEALIRTVVEDPADPFRVIELGGEALTAEPGRLGDAAATLPFGGGRAVVRVRGATNAHAGAFSDFLGDVRGDALVVANAGELKAGSALRRLFEGAKNAAAVACYADEGAQLARIIAETLRGHGLSATPEAEAYLCAMLGNDRAVTRNEIGKLALYMGGGGAVDIGDVMACVNDSGTTSLDAVCFAATSGDQAALEQALQRTFREGVHPVAVLRAAARHLLRLHQVSGLIAAGRGVDQAVKSLRPPPFFKLADHLRLQAPRWPPPRLGGALDIVTNAELECKTTGLPAEAVCGRALMRIAQAARHGAARR